MPCYCYITVSAEDKILIFDMDPANGDLKLLDTYPLSGIPGPLAMGPDQKQIYICRRGIKRTTSLAIDHQTGALSETSSVSIDDDHCYLYVDRSGKNLLSASYGGGFTASHRIKEDGTLIEEPNCQISTAIKAHFIQTDRSNAYAFVPHVGESNAIFQFHFDSDTGLLSPNDIPRVSPPGGVGPRHMEFHPALHMVYVSNEQGSSISTYKFDPASGTLALSQTLSTLPEGYSEHNSCAQIHIAPSGSHVYVSNRGHDSIACFAIDPTSGELTALGQQPTESVPRAFNIDPTGSFLYAGGQTSGKLASYRILESGLLDPLKTYAVGLESLWVLFVESKI